MGLQGQTAFPEGPPCCHPGTRPAQVGRRPFPSLGSGSGCREMGWRGWGAYTELPQPARLGSLAWPDGAPAHSSPTMLRLIHSRNLYVLKPKPIQNCLKFQTGQSSSWACSWAVHPPPPVASQALGKCAAHTWPLCSAPVLAWPSPQQPRARVIGTGRGGGDGLSQWSVSQAFRPKGRSCAPPVLKKFREVSLTLQIGRAHV